MQRVLTNSWVAAAIVITTGLMAAVCDADDANPLEPFGYEPTADGVRQCLAGFVVDDKTLETIRGHIAQLGDDDFLVREEATKALLRMPVLPKGVLDEAAASDDAEVRIRARRVIESRADDPAKKMLAAALRTIEQRKLQGLAAESITALEFASDQELREPAAKALQTTSTKVDQDRLTEALKSSSPVVRGAAIQALAAVAGKQAAKRLQPALGDKDDHVRLAAALALTNLDDRQALATLGELLTSDQYLVRLKAVQSLRAATGQKHQFDASAGPDNTAEEVSAWQRWLADHGKTAKLALPIKPPDENDLLADGFSAWVGIMQGRPVKSEDLGGICKIEGGALKIPADVDGYLRTKQAHRNYRLSIEYRWPEAVFNDAGLLIMLRPPDTFNGNAIEVQLHQGNVGDLYRLGRVEGEFAVGVGSRKGGKSEKPQGEWNRIDVEIRDGNAAIKLNGVLQNEVKNGSKEPTHIGLRIEDYPIEFRQIKLLPLD